MHDHALGHAGAGRRGWLCRNRSASVSDSAVPRHKGVSGGGTGGRPPFIRSIVKKKRGKKMHIRKKDLFMGAKVYKPDQIKELNFDCLIVCILNHNNEILRTCINE